MKNTLQQLLLILLTITFLALIEGVAQEPPMPPRFARTPTFSAPCPHCGYLNTRLRPMMITTNESHTVEGGLLVNRTLGLKCKNCDQIYSAKNEKLVPHVTATEDSENSITNFTIYANDLVLRTNDNGILFLVPKSSAQN